ncbi:hypothetical protein KBB12_01040 [Candidatus Woesebacteria bacterium]|nr:hypothetical protein [Candidatus Woesebacteria bacterium]
MESRHTAKNMNVSIRKVRSFLPGIRKTSPVDALTRLEQMPHSAARALAQAIKTCLSNAESSLKVGKDMLEFRRLYADQGLVLKRFRAGSRGTAKPITRRMTHITVVLGIKRAQSSAQADPVVEPKKEVVVEKQKVIEKKVAKTKSVKPKTKTVSKKKASIKEN